MTYRIAFGLRAGQKVLTLRGATPRESPPRQPLCTDIDGFSLQAAMRIEAHDRKRPGATIPHHHLPGAVRRAGTVQRRRAGGAQAQDTVARRPYAPGDDAVGVHAEAGCAGASAEAAPHRTTR